MKNLYKNSAVRLFLLCFCLGFILPYTKADNPNRTLKEPKEEKQRVIKATYKVSSTDQLHLSNKYGNITLSNHDKNEVALTVTILAWASKASDAQKALDRIGIEQEKEGSTIRFETQIEEQRGGYSCSNREGFEINYEVRMPKSLNVSIQNKFGSVTLNDLNGKLNLELKHGNLNAHNLTGAAHAIALAFGNLSINEISSASIEVAHGNVNIERSVASLSLITKHSNVRIDEAKDLDIEAKHGNVRIGTVSRVVGESKFGRVEIRKLLKSAEIILKHGNCQIEQIVKGFDTVDIENAYGAVELRFDSDAKFLFETETTYGSIRNSMPNTAIQRERSDDSEKILEGKVNGGGSAKVKVNNQHGSIRLEER